VSHSRLRLVSTPIERPEEIFYRLPPGTQVVGIDEVQFFGPEVVPVCEALASRGLRVICAGLDQDFQGRPFEPMPQLMAVAEYVTKQLAICVVCGNPAHRSQRLVASGDRVVVGAAGAYEARCRKCHLPEAAEATPAPQTLELFHFK
jgi:thymidine kinase